MNKKGRMVFLIKKGKNGLVFGFNLLILAILISVRTLFLEWKYKDLNKKGRIVCCLALICLF